MKINHMLAACAVLLTGHALAGTPVISISSTLAFPSEVVRNTTAIATYTVTNNAPITLTHLAASNLGGATQVTGSGLCSSGPFSLASGASCTLKLSYNATQAGSVSAPGPRICNGNVNCSQPPSSEQINFSVINEPTPEMPTLSLPDSLLVVPGQTSVLTVTNPSSTVTANDVNVTVPDSVSDQLSAGGSCASIAPGGTCDIDLTATESLNVPDETNLTVSGSNTQRGTVSLTQSDSFLLASTVEFTEPGEQNLTLTNQSNATIVVNSVEVPKGTGGISIGSIDACSSLVSGASCTVPITADASAYGNGNLTISYTKGSSDLSTTAAFTVGNTSVTINSGNDVSLPGTTDMAQTIDLDNTGAFNLHSPVITLGSTLGDTLSLDSSDCTDFRTIGPGESCTLSLTTVGASSGESTTLAASGNFDTASINLSIAGSVAVEADNDAANIHLQDRAIKITNSTGSSATLSNTLYFIDPDLLGKIVGCPAGDTNCNYQSTCVPGAELSDGSSCLLWFEAKNPGGTDPETASGIITVVPVTGGASTEFTTSYALQLYAGGTFTTDGDGNSAQYIARWNGASWSGVGGGLNGTSVRALATSMGDLFVGGDFTGDTGKLSMNNIGRWNGQGWAAVGSGVNAQVNALASLDNVLYVGGTFTSPADYLAQWNGSSWSRPTGIIEGDFNGEVNALTTNASALFIGGAFNDIAATYLAQYTPDSTTLSNLNAGSANLNGKVNALAQYNDVLYVGGIFTDPYAKTAQYDINSTTWSALGTDLAALPHDVYALVADDAILYAGGFTFLSQWDFASAWTTPGDQGFEQIYALAYNNSILFAAGNYTIPTNYLAQWNGTTWSAVGTNGFNGTIYTLLVAPAITEVSATADKQ